MVYVIENEGHQQVGATLNTLGVVKRPDGGITNNAKVGEALHDENGGAYHIREVVDATSGNGPRKLNTAHPEYVDGKGWQRITKYGADLPAPADSQGVDDKAKGFDPDYANNYKGYRQQAYPSIDEITVALWEKTVEDRGDAATAIEALRQAVKTKYPSPEKIAADKAKADKAAADKAAADKAAADKAAADKAAADKAKADKAKADKAAG